MAETPKREAQPRQSATDLQARTPLGSFIVDGRGTILGFDPGMESLTGWPVLEVVGRHKDQAQTRIDPDKGECWSRTRSLYLGSIPLPAQSQPVEVRLCCRDGRFLDAECVATRLRGSGDWIAVTVHRVLSRSAADVAERDLDRCDPVTGLSGHDAFLRRLQGCLRSATAIGRPLAVVLADVDHLRRVNDRHGRAAGTELLRKLAGILRAEVPDEDLVARVGDDDFAMILVDAGRGEARQAAARLRSTVEKFRFFGSHENEEPLHVTLSLGAASYPADADNAADLLERAREALEEARSFGRNRVWCYLRRPRVPVQVPVYFDGTESTLLGFSLDLSPSGVFVKTPTPVDVGMRCALTFPLPGTTGNVHVVGRVVRTVPAEYAPPSEHRAPGMGIEFERLGPADRRALHAFFHQHDLPTRRPENGTFSV